MGGYVYVVQVVLVIGVCIVVEVIQEQCFDCVVVEFVGWQVDVVDDYECWYCICGLYFEVW